LSSLPASRCFSRPKSLLRYLARDLSLLTFTAAVAAAAAAAAARGTLSDEIGFRQ